MQNTLTTPREFLDRIVVPDIEALMQAPHDVRLAFHASASIHHLREWVFKAGLTTYRGLSDYCENDLYIRCPDLKLIRDLASNAKHFPPDAGRAEKLVVGASAASTCWDSPTTMWDIAEWDKSEQMQVIAAKEDGSKEWMVPILMKGFHFWKNEFDTNGW